MGPEFNWGTKVIVLVVIVIVQLRTYVSACVWALVRKCVRALVSQRVDSGKDCFLSKNKWRANVKVTKINSRSKILCLFLRHSTQISVAFIAQWHGLSLTGLALDRVAELPNATVSLSHEFVLFFWEPVNWTFMLNATSRKCVMFFSLSSSKLTTKSMLHSTLRS